MPSLKQIVECNDTPLGRVFDASIQFVIVVSLVSYCVDTVPDLSPPVQQWLRALEFACVAIFSIEYVLRVWVAKPKRGYVLSFFGLVDLAVIVPYYIGLGVDLRSLRAFRLLRLFRLFKLTRYNSAVRRFHRALIIAKEEIVLFLGASAVLLFISAAGIHFFESEAQPETFGTLFHCLWWGVTTLTTVGYGDVYPITTGGRVFTFLVLLVGLGIISVPAGLVASALATARRMEEEEQREEQERARELKDPAAPTTIREHEIELPERCQS